MYRSHEAKILVSHGLEAGHWVLKTRWILGLIEQQQYLLTYEGVEDRHGLLFKNNGGKVRLLVLAHAESEGTSMG